MITCTRTQTKVPVPADGVHWVENEMNKKIAGPAKSHYCDFGGISWLTALHSMPVRFPHSLQINCIGSSSLGPSYALLRLAGKVALQKAQLPDLHRSSVCSVVWSVRRSGAPSQRLPRKDKTPVLPRPIDWIQERLQPLVKITFLRQSEMWSKAALIRGQDSGAMANVSGAGSSIFEGTGNSPSSSRTSMTWSALWKTCQRSLHLAWRLMCSGTRNTKDILAARANHQRAQQVVRNKYGRKFLGCSNYAKKKCRYTKALLRRKERYTRFQS